MRKTLFLWFLLSGLTTLVASAQTPCFTAVGGNGLRRGCAPFTVTVTDCSGGGINLLYKYGETNQFVSATSYTYNRPGVYAITQVGSFAGQGDSLRRDAYIEVLPSPPPVFSVRYCAGREVSLTINDNTYESYLINWGDGATQTVNRGAAADVRHNYTTLSTFSLTVTGNYVPGGCGGVNGLLVTPLLAIPAPQVISLSTPVVDPANGSIDIVFSSNSSFEYQIQLRPTTTPIFTTLATIRGNDANLTFTATNLNTRDQTYVMRVVAIDACGGSLSSADFFNLTLNAAAQDSRNQLNWQSYQGAGFQQYAVTRNSANITTLNALAANSFTDNNVICTENYCYQLIATVGSPTSTQIRSNVACATAFSSTIPPAVANLNAGVQQNSRVLLNWAAPVLPPITQHIIRRTVTSLVQAGAPIVTETIVRDPNQTAIDNEYANAAGQLQYCYEIRYVNQCGNTAPVALPTCPVSLRLLRTAPDRVEVGWTRYENSSGLIQQVFIEKLDENGSVYFSQNVGNSAINFADVGTTQDRQVLRYRVRVVVDAATNLVSFSNVLEVQQAYRVFFPNAFTPNGDGLNDTFEGQGLFVRNFRMVVYNRSGEQLFTSNNLTQGWDGRAGGGMAPADVYVYIAEIEDFTGAKFTSKGTFTLIR
ncbi:MAG TPA: hypothetical protein DCM08_12530 [Microscillaceae bacterium]|jgi:gliding motility-associated-like protein|nr:hypothetical protein [Microscillaceae bacterium]